MTPRSNQRGCCLIVLLNLCMLSCNSIAQESECRLMTFKEATKPLYPPLAYAAHVQGAVLLNVSFRRDGTAEKIGVVEGPEWLRSSAIAYVQGWRANSDTHTRTCSVILEYKRQTGNEDLPLAVHLSATHVLINSPQMLIQP